MIEKFLTTEQVANILQMHPFTILKFIREGKLKGLKLGRVYRIKESDVHEFLESRMTGSRTTAQKPKKIQVENEKTVKPEIQSEKKNSANTHFDLKKDDGEHYFII
ncbi:MAG: helix-turn-helix domain-containing protein [bacterium]|nr:helix-turn-helix domain-containing protein [bacterium]